jgi:hypothetical protein
MNIRIVNLRYKGKKEYFTIIKEIDSHFVATHNGNILFAVKIRFSEEYYEFYNLNDVIKKIEQIKKENWRIETQILFENAYEIMLSHLRDMKIDYLIEKSIDEVRQIQLLNLGI